jgi:hypothetical protein
MAKRFGWSPHQTSCSSRLTRFCVRVYVYKFFSFPCRIHYWCAAWLTLVEYTLTSSACITARRSNGPAALVGVQKTVTDRRRTAGPVTVTVPAAGSVKRKAKSLCRARAGDADGLAGATRPSRALILHHSVTCRERKRAPLPAQAAAWPGDCVRYGERVAADVWHSLRGPHECMSSCPLALSTNRDTQLGSPQAQGKDISDSSTKQKRSCPQQNLCHLLYAFVTEEGLLLSADVPMASWVVQQLGLGMQEWSHGPTRPPNFIWAASKMVTPQKSHFGGYSIFFQRFWHKNDF